MAASPATRARAQQRRALILAYLRTNPQGATSAELAAVLGLSPHTLHNDLARMYTARTIARAPHNLRAHRYTAATSSQEPQESQPEVTASADDPYNGETIRTALIVVNKQIDALTERRDRLVLLLKALHPSEVTP